MTTDPTTPPETPQNSDSTPPPAAPPTREFRPAPAGGDGAPPPTTVAGTGASEHDPGYISVRLPPVLEELFEPIAELASGGQATVVHCRRRSAPEQEVAIKLYHVKASPTQADPREVFRGLSPEHVVTYVEPYFGIYNQRWWEVQEYIPAGNLRELALRQGGVLSTTQIEQIVIRMTEALDALHAHEPHILHRDIKPENLLIRQREPLHVVLADFGLAVLTDMSQDRHSGSRTDAYAAPEAPFGDMNPALDWWSLGMSIAELAAGRHPYTLADGRFMNPRAISAAIATRPVPLEGIDDERLLMLLRGLLTRDPEQRWRAEQVRRWLAGESPAVADAETRVEPVVAQPGSTPTTGHVGAVTASSAVEPFPFMRRDFTTPEELAAAIIENWGRAAAQIAAKDLTRMAEWVEKNFPDRSITDIARVFEQGRSSSDRDINVLVARIIIRLDLQGEPVFMGETIDMASLAEWATRINTDAGRHLRDVVEWLFDSRLLLEYRRFPGNADLAHVEDVWQELCDSAQTWFSAVPEAGGMTPEIRALILRVAVAKIAGVEP